MRAVGLAVWLLCVAVSAVAVAEVYYAHRIVLTLKRTPVVGDTIILVVAIANGPARSVTVVTTHGLVVVTTGVIAVTGVTETGVAWSLLSTASSYGTRAELWVGRVTQRCAGTGIVVTLDGTPQATAASAEEYSNLRV